MERPRKRARVGIDGATAEHAQVELTKEEKELFEMIRDVIREEGLKTTVRVAGGWVRDKLMGRDSHDIDLAVDDMSGKAFANLMNEYLAQKGQKTSRIGLILANPEQSKHLETAALVVMGMHIDIVNLRSEQYQESSRIPSIRFGTPLEDAQRRDFTINSLFYNVNDSTVEDFTGHGLSDLERCIIRTPLAPSQTFLDDPLRMLRAVRFASRFNFSLDSLVVEALGDSENLRALDSKISRERIGSEVQGMMRSAHPEIAVGMLEQFRLFPIVFKFPDYIPSSPRGDFREEEIQEQIELNARSLGELQSADWSNRSKVAVNLINSVAANRFQSKQYLVDSDPEFIPLTGLLYGFDQLDGLNSKGKLEPLVVLILRDSLKLKLSIPLSIKSVCQAATEIAGVASKLHQSKSDTPSQDMEDTLCKNIGRIMFDLGSNFSLAVTLAAVLNPDLDPYLEELYSKAIGPWCLSELWGEKMLFNGKDLIAELGLSKGGPYMTTLMNHQKDWIVLNRRHGSLEAEKQRLLEFLLSLKEQVLLEEEQRVVQVRIAKEEELRRRKEAKERARLEKEKERQADESFTSFDGTTKASTSPQS